VVGADGSKGLTRRLVLPNGRRIKVARLLEVLVPVDTTLPHFAGRYARFDFTPAKKDLQGYYWEFPSWVEGKPVLNCGIYDARFVNKRGRADLPALLESSLAERGFESGSRAVQGHPIHWFSPRARLAIPRLLLVGDAAGAEPLFGEGIAPALAYGKIAAEAIAAAFASGDLSFRDYKHRVLTSHLGRYLLLRWCVSWWAYHLSWNRTFMHTLWAAGNRLSFLY
jgi:flavin-dependent dehydrogenase